jgi:hypothetical protein
MGLVSSFFQQEEFRTVRLFRTRQENDARRAFEVLRSSTTPSAALAHLELLWQRYDAVDLPETKLDIVRQMREGLESAEYSRALLKLSLKLTPSVVQMQSSRFNGLQGKCRQVSDCR